MEHGGISYAGEEVNFAGCIYRYLSVYVKAG